MTLAHLSDTHLGFRAYGRTAPGGMNLREVDVMRSFEACLDAIQAADPDLVVHAGDMFHVVRPSNATIVEAYAAVGRLQAARGGKPFVIIGGNHDTPRTIEAGNILRLFEGIPGVLVRSGKSGFIESPLLDALDCEVFCVPHHSLAAKEAGPYRPSGTKRHSVITVHGSASGVVQNKSEFEVDPILSEDWTYVALGDYHIYKRYGGNACYTGATDFTSSNIWEEANERRGWVLFDSQTGDHTFHDVETRKVVDLPRIDALHLQPEELNRRLVENAQEVPEGVIVRQVVENVFPGIRAKIDQAIMRNLNDRFLVYRLDTRPPGLTLGANGDARKPVRTLEHAWQEYVCDPNRSIGVDKQKLMFLGLELLREVNEGAASDAEA
jgi:DNA repair exonuclease SbcCD nuclease subunit